MIRGVPGLHHFDRMMHVRIEGLADGDNRLQPSFLRDS